MEDKKREISNETHCVHSFHESDVKTMGVNTPIEPSSAFKYKDGINNIYPRYYNTVNQKVICDKISALEYAEETIIFSSGMAAISTTLLSLLSAGDHILFYGELYGGTYNLISEEFDKRNILFSIVEKQTEEEFTKCISKKTKVIYFESPTNPLLSIVDISFVTDLAKKHQILTVIDNTFASPINQNPIRLNVDLVIHSGTKYLGGHSDLSFGAVSGRKILVNEILKTAINYGGNLNPFDCYLIERSIKTLDVRVKRQNKNALEIAKFLEGNKMVKKVYYPGLVSHPMHMVAKKQMQGFGGMLSFELEGDEAMTDIFLDSLNIIVKALSLGGVESNICVPSKTSHIKMSKEDRLKIGVVDNLLRLSVGIENVNDLIEDIANALKMSTKK